MLLGVNPGMDIFGPLQVFFSDCGDLLSHFQRLSWAPPWPLGLRWSAVANEGSDSYFSRPSPLLTTLLVHQDVWTWYQEPSDISSYRGQSVDSYLFFRQWRENSELILHICMHQGNNLSVQVFRGCWDCRKQLFLHPSQAKRWDLLSWLGMHGLPPRDCCISTIAFVWSQSEVRRCVFVNFWLWFKPGRTGLLPLQFSGSIHFAQREV